MDRDVIELADADLDYLAGGGALHVIRVIFIPGTSSAPGGTGTDNGPTATNGQAWITSAS